MKTACVSTFDSFLRSSRMLAEALAPHGVSAEHIVMRVRVDQISDDQIKTILGGPATHVCDLEETMALLQQGGYDWVILSAENTSCRRFFELMGRTAFPNGRPLVATIYPGILFRYHYDGFSARMPADLVILNSAKDSGIFAELRRAYGRTDDNSFNLGPVTVIGTTGFQFQPERRMVLFFDQPSVPHTREEKLHIFAELARLAALHPQLDFAVKLRVGPKDATLHKGGQGTLDYLNEFNRSLPPGTKPLRLVDGAPRDLISQSVLALSVSSTALVEALACGCPAMSIADFGIDEDYGGSFFAASGISGLLESLDPQNPPAVCPDWYQENVGNADAQSVVLAARMREMTAAHSVNPQPPPSIHPFYGSASFCRFAVAKFGARKAISRRYRNRHGIVLAKYALNFVTKRFLSVFRLFHKH